MFLISTLLFAVAFGAALVAVYQIVVRDRDPVVARLRDLRTRALEARPEANPHAPSPIAAILAAIGGFLPTGDSSETLRSGLVRAGIREPSAPIIFLGTKAVLGVVGGVGWGAVNWAL